MQTNLHSIYYNLWQIIAKGPYVPWKSYNVNKPQLEEEYDDNDMESVLSMLRHIVLWAKMNLIEYPCILPLKKLRNFGILFVDGKIWPSELSHAANG